MANDIETTLAERGQRYGVFAEQAKIAQGLKRVFQATPKWPLLRDDMRETLDMLANKLGRILNGDPEFHDSWHDIIGYTKLVSDTLTPAAGHAPLPAPPPAPVPPPAPLPPPTPPHETEGWAPA